MEMTVVTVGAICLIAAIAGGGFEALGIKVPLVPSLKRQVILGGIGLLLVLTPTVAKWLPSPTPPGPGKPDFATCGRLVSTNSKEEVDLVFENDSQRTVDIYWLTQQGVAQFEARLAPRGTYPVTSYLGHGWCIMDSESGKAIQTMTVAPNMENIPIH